MTSVKPFTNNRIQPVRRLTPAECDLLEYEPPLTLARREYRFFLGGPWRPAKNYLVIKNTGVVVMDCTKAQLRGRGIAMP